MSRFLYGSFFMLAFMTVLSKYYLKEIGLSFRKLFVAFVIPSIITKA